MNSYNFLLVSIFTLFFNISNAQEYITPLPKANPKSSVSFNLPPSGMSLPFFDDFSYKGPYTNSSLWLPNNVLVNNTFAKSSPTYGVATLDATNRQGTPYDTSNRNNKVWADSLISVKIDLSTSTPNDNVALSFFIQSEGNAFSPKPNDSFFVFFKRANGIWQREWATGYENDTNFRPIYIPIINPDYFHDNFAFMFVNTATLGVNNSNWHIDYVWLDENRSNNPDDISDIGISHIPSTILNNYHNMPYNHFIANINKYLKPSINWSITNLSQQIVNGSASSSLKYNGNILQNNTDNYNIGSNGISNININLNNTLFNSINESHFKIDFSYTISDVLNNTFHNNTINTTHEFGNYFAYDDGSPELAYYLTMHPSYNIPAYTAVKFETEVADTLRGFSIFLPKTAPIGRNKEFGIKIFSEISYNGATEQELYEELYIYPKYNDTINAMVHYKFEKPTFLPKGTFYMALMQPAGGYSDSLYIGLDITNNVVQERYFNVLDSWEPSTLPGALLFRPIIGSDFNTGIQKFDQQHSLQIFPNPTTSVITFSKDYQVDHATIFDMNGKKVLNTPIDNHTLNLEHLQTGIYILSTQYKEKKYPMIKIEKL
jgi:hypothetical protein